METVNKMYKSERLNKRNQNKPIIKLRSVSSLLDKNKQSIGMRASVQKKGQLLKKALKNNLKKIMEKVEERPIVDVFESIVNRKVTYTPQPAEHKKCNSESDICLCDECSLESSFLSTSRFGKVYPSPNSSAIKNNNVISYTNIPDNISVDDKKISLPPTTPAGRKSLASRHMARSKNVSSIFGKVYVKKTNNDLNFLKREGTEWDNVEKN